MTLDSLIARKNELKNAIEALDNASSLRLSVGPYGSPMVTLHREHERFVELVDLMRERVLWEAAEVEAGIRKHDG